MSLSGTYNVRAPLLLYYWVFSTYLYQTLIRTDTLWLRPRTYNCHADVTSTALHYCVSLSATYVAVITTLMRQLYSHSCYRDTFPFTTTAQTLCDYYACHSSIQNLKRIVPELLFLFLFTFHLSHPAPPTTSHTDTRLPQVATPMSHLPVTDIKTPTSHP